MRGTGVRIACVAGGFPHGRAPISEKLGEIAFAIAQGADEIDFTVDRRAIAQERFAELTREVRAAKDACGEHLLKVILETGEIGTAVAPAAAAALDGGADFVKTSTGALAPGATFEAARAICEVLQTYEQRAGRRAGLKVSGGIRSAAQAQRYAEIVRETLGERALNPLRFRIGTSALLDELAGRGTGPAAG